MVIPTFEMYFKGEKREDEKRQTHKQTQTQANKQTHTNKRALTSLLKEWTSFSMNARSEK